MNFESAVAREYSSELIHWLAELIAIPEQPELTYAG